MQTTRQKPRYRLYFSPVASDLPRYESWNCVALNFDAIVQVRRLPRISKFYPPLNLPWFCNEEEERNIREVLGDLQPVQITRSY